MSDPHARTLVRIGGAAAVTGTPVGLLAWALSSFPIGIVATTTVWIALAVWLATDRMLVPKAWVFNYLPRHFQSRYALARLVLAGLAGIVFWFTVGRAEEYALYWTGKFGEPPWNRFVRVNASVCGDSPKPRSLPCLAVIEFGVRLVPVGPLALSVKNASPVRQDYFAKRGWFNRSGLTQPLPDEGLGSVGIFFFQQMTRAFLPNGSVTPERSVYVEVESAAPIETFECSFAIPGEEPTPICGDGVDLVMP
jgi:hypothetical protein